MTANRIALEYALKHTPNPCTDCPERKVGCYSVCPKRPQHLRDLEALKQKIFSEIEKQNAASAFLKSSARATAQKDIRRKRRG